MTNLTKENVLSIIQPLKQYASQKNDIPLGSLLNNIKSWEIDFNLERNPDFQRGHVWTLEQKVAFIENLLRNENTNTKILINRHGLMQNTLNPDFKYSGKYVIIDGLQRLTAMEEFCLGKFKVFNNQLSFEDLKEVGLTKGLNYNIEVHFFEMASEEEILDYYLSFNTGVTPHSKEEIKRVRQLKEQAKK